MQFDENKLLDNQIKRLAEVMDKMATDYKAGRLNELDLTNLIFTEAEKEVTEISQL